jgi:hypothetical protein
MCISGCVSVEPMQVTKTPPERIYVKNYELQKLQRAYVVETIIKFKDYWESQIIKDKLEAQNDFELNIGNRTFYGLKGSKYSVFGVTTRNGNKIYLIQHPNLYQHFYVGITEEGYLANFLVEILGPNSHAVNTVTKRSIIPVETKL